MPRQSYLLRLWSVRDGERLLWRAFIKNAHSGNEYHFNNLKALFDFIEAETTCSVEGQGRVNSPVVHSTNTLETPAILSF